MDSKLWDTKVVFYIGLGVLLIAALAWELRPQPRTGSVARRNRARNFWLKWLIQHGPQPLSKLPVCDGKLFPVEEYRRAGLIEVETAEDLIVHASGLARSILD